MEVAIVGAGIAGSYLYRLLRMEGFRPDIYDLEHKTMCGINPCGWGTNKEFLKLIEKIGMNSDEYVKEEIREVSINGVRTDCELYIINKPKFIRDLRDSRPLYTQTNGEHICLDDYDRVIDATGVARAYLSPIVDDLIMPCVQYRVNKNVSSNGNMAHMSKIGYAWNFRLGFGQYHIGCGSLLEDPQSVLNSLGWANSPNIVCNCKSKVRITSPHYSQPFVEFNKIWGVGESIGVVSPLAGDGIVPGMRSCNILIKNWDNPEKYANRILSEFNWMKNEREIMDKMRKKEKLSMGDYFVLMEDAKRMGIKMGIKGAHKLLNSWSD